MSACRAAIRQRAVSLLLSGEGEKERLLRHAFSELDALERQMGRERKVIRRQLSLGRQLCGSEWSGFRRYRSASGLIHRLNRLQRFQQEVDSCLTQDSALEGDMALLKADRELIVLEMSSSAKRKEFLQEEQKNLSLRRAREALCLEELELQEGAGVRYAELQRAEGRGGLYG